MSHIHEASVARSPIAAERADPSASSCSKRPKIEHIEHSDDARTTASSPTQCSEITHHPNRWARWRAHIREPAAESVQILHVRPGSLTAGADFSAP
jgi:hypothetical protein